MATDQSYSTEEATTVVEDLNQVESSWPHCEEGFWHSCAPSSVRRHYAAGDAARGWKRWRRYVLDRSAGSKAQRLAEKLTGGRKRAAEGLYFDLPSIQDRSPGLAWLLNIIRARPRRARQLASESPRYVEAWLDSTANLKRGWADAEQAAEAVAWAQALVPIARFCDCEAWWHLIERLCQLAGAGSSRRSSGAASDVLVQNWTCGELPWTLAAMFSEIEPCRELAPAAVNSLSETISDVLDGEGVPQARYLPVFDSLVASWTRCRLLSAAIESMPDHGALGNCWDDDGEQQYFQAVREVVRLRRNDGTAVLSPLHDDSSAAERNIASLLSVAVGLAPKDDKRYRQTIGLIAESRELTLCNSKKNSHEHAAKWSKGIAKHLPDAAFHSEWARLAMLQTDWSRCANRLAVDYSGVQVRVELQSDRRLLFHGDWDFEVRADGVLLAPKGNWAEVCWVSDADCDYLELELELNDGVRIQRQILLSRRDEFLFLADAVLGRSPAALSYCGRLPLAPLAAATAVKETRELLLGANKPRATVFPLELPEWRVDPLGGTLTAELAGPNTVGRVDHGETATNGHAANGLAANGVSRNGLASPSSGRICLNQSVHGVCLFAPLWLDLSPKRARKHGENPSTWRQLTVAEQRQILPRDAAVAYRIQAGERQWVVYRSLAAPANRTFLGINLSSEFFVGRFQSDGETESVVEIEG